MAKVESKGTTLQQEIGGVMTNVAQLTDLSYSGGEVETYDSTTLDGGVGKTYSRTGYSEGGEVSLSGYFDPSLAGHQALTDLITTPAEQAWDIDFSDTKSMPFTGAGISWEFTAAMSDGLKFSSTIKVTGLPTYQS